MLEHLQHPPKAPARAVVMGGQGFVGAAVARHLRAQGVNVLPLSRAEIDLLQADAAEKLAAKLRGDDCFIFVSALAPCRDLDLFTRNMTMVRAACAALEKRPVAHVVNISSDAVYAPAIETVDERTPAAPSDLHGMMHAARELMLQTAVKAPVCILRPSLLYGAADPHNGYGPNRFRRLAAEGKEIPLFGNGEEQRDHVLIDDVAALVGLCVLNRSKGVLNIATGRSVSFRQVAEMVVAGHRSASKITPSPRRNPILHRHFDVVDRIKAFPRFAFTALEQGLARVQAETGAPRG
jgi:nucleoside-diphosphate-sugar epimerase